MLELVIKKQLQTQSGWNGLNLELTIESGSLVAINGPSGSGKTTLLKIIAGLLPPDSGWIKFNQITWLNLGQKINIKPQARKVGMVFQDYALFPNMTVAQHLKFAQTNQPSTPMLIPELLEVMDLGALKDRYPHQLSGGQQQRVALARTLANQPRLLLLDEPLAALDEKSRQKLQNYILHFHQKYDLTTLIVTHNQRESIRMADRFIQIENGIVQQAYTLQELVQETGQGGAFRLTGELIKIQQKSGTTTGLVLVGNNLLKISFTDEPALKALKMGTTIELRFQNGTYKIV